MKILFATDGSYHSDNALESIIGRPWPDGSECRAVTVEAPFHALAIPGVSAMAAGAEAALEDDVKKLMAATALQLEPKFGKGKVSISIRQGSPAETIIEEAKNWRADLIVMGSHGTSGYNDESFGSVTIKVINHAPCSVQILEYITSASLQKKGATKTPLEETRFLLALNNSPNSRAVIDSVIARPWPAGSLFQLISVVPEPKTLVHSTIFKDPQIDQAHAKIYSEQKRAAEALLQEVLAKLEAKLGKGKVFGHVLEGNVRSLLLQVAQDWPADMIMLGAHDRDKSILEHFLGSVAQAVVNNAKCSIEIVRTKA